MIREEATEQILEAKKQKGLTFEAIAEEADAVGDLLDLDPEVTEALQEIPLRGSLDSDVPTDPTIYRIHEITQVYGTTIKALIHEEFGDGIMSAINFKMDIEKVEDPEGERVRITYEGKFLPYEW